MQGRTRRTGCVWLASLMLVAPAAAQGQADSGTAPAAGHLESASRSLMKMRPHLAAVQRFLDSVPARSPSTSIQKADCCRQPIDQLKSLLSGVQLDIRQAGDRARRERNAPVEDRLRRLAGQVSGIARSLDSLARTDDVTAARIAATHMEAGMKALEQELAEGKQCCA